MNLYVLGAKRPLMRQLQQWCNALGLETSPYEGLGPVRLGAKHGQRTALLVGAQTAEELRIAREEIQQILRRDVTGRSAIVLALHSALKPLLTEADLRVEEVVFFDEDGLTDAFRLRLLSERLKRQTDAHELSLFAAEMDDGLWIWDIEHDQIEWSPRINEAFGIALEETPESFQAFAALVHEDDRARISHALQAHLSEDVPYSVEFMIYTRDGNLRPMHASGRALRDASGQPIVMIGSVRDISPRVRVERALEASELRYAALFHSMNDAAAIGDLAGNFLDVNTQLARLLGRPRDALIGAHINICHAPGELDFIQAHFSERLEQLMRGEVPPPFSTEFLHASGTRFPVEISTSLIQSSGETLLLGIYRDMSDAHRTALVEREREAQLQFTSRLASMGLLAAGISHDINNPLSFIQGNLEFLYEELRSMRVDEELLEATHDAIEGAQRVGQIVRDLRDFVRPDRDTGSCDPVQVARFAARMGANELRHRAALELLLDPCPPVACPASKLSQILLNLITNAAHALPEEGQRTSFVRLSAYPLHAWVEVCVEDNGSGMTEAVRARAFEAFFTTKGPQLGTGLGLSICKTIIEEIGGTIDIDSAPGSGTRITLRLPAILHSRRTAEDIRPPAPIPDDLRVLIVDDEPQIARALQRLLPARTALHTSGHADEARAMLSQDTFDLILCDLMMPDVSGAQLHDTLATEDPAHAARMIFVTGGALTSAASAFLKREAYRVIFKPVQPDALAHAIHAMLARHGLNPG